ncbi:MAG: cellulase family glycosylhydrolase [Thermoproteota archaeon]|nr:cellulase family glycosylhydrolase [Thermoproteota archaeon]
MKKNDKKKFEVGINIPALNNEYGHDLGFNQFSGRQFWDESWQHFDFTRPDYKSTEFSPWINWQGENLQKTLQKFAGKVDLIRLWVFEQHEGLKFTNNNNSGSSNNTVTGIDEKQLLPNIERVLDKAQDYNMKVYLCLTDGWVVNNTFTPPGYEGEMLAKYRELQETRRSIMKNMVENPYNFIHNALDPLIKSVKDHPSLYAIDIMNEPEAMYDPSCFPVVSADSMKSFLVECSQAIKNYSNQKISVSTGMMKFESIMEYQISLPANTLDFYDYHMYSSDKGSIRKALSSYRQISLANKKMILGELGYKDSMEPSKKDKYKEMDLINAIFEYAYSSGISPCLLWDLDFYEPENREKLILLLKDYRDNNR